MQRRNPVCEMITCKTEQLSLFGCGEALQNLCDIQRDLRVFLD